MNIEQLKDRIEKKNKDIEKINRRIAKWSKNLTETEINQVKDTLNLTYREYRNSGAYSSDKDELRQALKDLNSANDILHKYQVSLDTEINKNNQEKIPVFVNFLNGWKAKVNQYVHENTKVVDEYYKINSEFVELHNNRWRLVPDEMSEVEYKLKRAELDERRTALKSNINAITSMVYSPSRGVNEKELTRILDEEANAKYWNMVNKVTEVVGEITDASGLRIGLDGNINGLIIGTNGKAKLETIGAGGYNNHIIVNNRHGQIFHFRLLVHPVRD